MMLTLESIALFEVLLKGKFQITDVFIFDSKPNDNISVWATTFFLEVSTQQAGSQIYILFWHWFSCISRCRYHPPKISIHIHSCGHLICIINSHHWHIHDKKKKSSTFAIRTETLVFWSPTPIHLIYCKLVHRPTNNYAIILFMYVEIT